MWMARKNTTYRGICARFVSNNIAEAVHYLLVITLSLLRATSVPNQLGLVAKNVKEDVWLCRYLGQRTGPDTEPWSGILGVRGFQQRSESVSVTQELQFL
jgi:hypothetical protein